MLFFFVRVCVCVVGSSSDLCLSLLQEQQPVLALSVSLDRLATQVDLLDMKRLMQRSHSVYTSGARINSGLTHV